MVNNFDRIRGLLEFKSKDDFYFLQILQRKKDHKEGKVNGTNNNSRLIKAYYVYSLEYFDFIMPEVIEMCKLFNARAGINLNRRSFKKMQLQHLKKITEQLLNNDHDKSHRAYNTVCGAFSHDSDKKWILDIDDKDYDPRNLLGTIHQYQPTGDKFIARIPSKNGYHLIVSPFNLQEFKKDERFRDIEVHKNNPTNLFIP
jgi:hypothetical protein